MASPLGCHFRSLPRKITRNLIKIWQLKDITTQHFSNHLTEHFLLGDLYYPFLCILLQFSHIIQIFILIIKFWFLASSQQVIANHPQIEGQISFFIQRHDGCLRVVIVIGWYEIVLYLEDEDVIVALQLFIGEEGLEMEDFDGVAMDEDPFRQKPDHRVHLAQFLQEMAQICKQGIEVFQLQWAKSVGVGKRRARRLLINHIVLSLILEDFNHFGEHLGSLRKLKRSTLEHLIPTHLGLLEAFQQHILTSFTTDSRVDEALLVFGELKEVLVLIEHGQFYSILWQCKDSFLVMRMRLLFVLVLGSGLVLAVFAGIEFPEGFEGGWGFGVLVPDELAVAEGNLWKNFVDFFFAVVKVHILCAYLVLFFLVADDPVAAGGMETHLLGDFAENLIIDDNQSLRYRFLAFRFGLLLCHSLYRCRRVFVSKNIVIAFGIFLTLLFFFGLLRLLVIIEKHAVIFCQLCLDLFLVIVDLGHEAHIDEAVDLLLLVFRPNVLRPLLALLLQKFCKLRLLWSRCHLLFNRLFIDFFGKLRRVLSIGLFLQSFASEIIFKKLFFMSFEYLLFFYGLISQLLNNLLNDSLLNLFALDIPIKIFI